MSVEYGLFSDEGLVEDGFYSREEAEAGLENYSDEDDLRISEICPEHHDQERHYCEECNAEEEDEDGDEEEDDEEDYSEYPVKG